MSSPQDTEPAARPGGSVQVRSHDTQRAFLDAAERLFGERGIEATPVTDVAARADRSIGSLYHHFEHKQALVDAVVERVTGRLEANVARAIDPASWSGTTIADVVSTYVATSLALSRRHPGDKRITIEASLIDHAARDRYRRIRRSLDDGLVVLLLDRRDEIGHPDPELAARFAVDQLTAMLAARLDREMTPTQLEATSDEAFAEQVTASIVGYLCLDDRSS